ncbi:methyltransferase [Rhodococcoides trifolii]|uniref:Methyltransferase n=1 Tax=Rhodococcoides trifolii TaxID=908250 RepID=A0A917G2Q7_9NOCA|nr:SAM-dependent methyltransferase [Rhodococcus trifolii]GGG20208.1 methyltransferase [Rhodococcus trifolii]
MTALPDKYFDDMYSANPDPWGFETRWYERRKYDLTMAMLPEERYRRAFEPGCSIGVLTERIAARCDSVLSTDIAAAALERARARNLANVTFEQSSLRDGRPDETFDLVVLSEMAYYFTEAELPSIATTVRDALEIGGTLIAVHWRHHVDDYPTDAQQVHEVLRATDGLRLDAQYSDADILADVMQRVR